MNKFVVLSVGCLECGVWTYVHATCDTEEQGMSELRRLSPSAEPKAFTPTGDEDFDRCATCVAYSFDGDRIAELHRLP